MLNLLTYGLDDTLDHTSRQVEIVKEEVFDLAQQHINKLEGDDQKKVRKRWLAVRDTLNKSHQTLEFMAKKYALSADEKLARKAAIQQKLAEMYGIENVRNHVPQGFPEELIPLPPVKKDEETKAKPKDKDAKNQKKTDKKSEESK
jgi:hypothetical protein